MASLYCIPTAKCKGSSFSTSSPTLVVFCFFLVVATLIGVRRLGGCFCSLTSFSHGCYVSFACSTKSIFIIEGPQSPRGCAHCTGDQRERQGTQRRKSRAASGLIAALRTECWRVPLTLASDSFRTSLWPPDHPEFSDLSSQLPRVLSSDLQA